MLLRSRPPTPNRSAPARHCAPPPPAPAPASLAPLPAAIYVAAVYYPDAPATFSVKYTLTITTNGVEQSFSDVLPNEYTENAALPSGTAYDPFSPYANPGNICDPATGARCIHDLWTITYP